MHHAHKPDEMIQEDQDFVPEERFSEKEVILITYGDLIYHPEKSPLRALADFLETFVRGAINTIHILPFFPYSSDRGFAVVDFEQVDPRIGSWQEIDDLAARYQLMFDGVINHVSAESRWFREFRHGNPEYEDFFITFSSREAVSDEHLKLVMRPRSSDLLTPYSTIHGQKYVWTTFSPDQIDLNYHNEKVLLRIIDILLRYVRHGADIIRLDAITYVWTELGTRCAHLEESHAIVQLFRSILDCVAPRVALLTETNIAHEENTRYFGNGYNEAQLVYNFTLPPMVLHTFQTGDCTKLSNWAAGLEKISNCATYVNFLDSHDGIPILPAEGILTTAEIDSMIEKVKEHGGLISYRSDPVTGSSPYEMNITWYSAMNNEESNEPVDRQVDRFIASRSIALALRGVPAVYLPSLIGSRNDLDAVVNEGIARAINRRTICKLCLNEHLADKEGSASKVAARFARLIDYRTQNPAFHPNGDQKILHLSRYVFAVLRTAPDRKQTILSLTNVTDQKQEIALSADDIGIYATALKDLLSDQQVKLNGRMARLQLHPYEVLWLEAESQSSTSAHHD